MSWGPKALSGLGAILIALPMALAGIVQGAGAAAATTAAPPDAPASAPGVSAGQQAVQVFWQVPNDSGPPITSFEIDSNVTQTVPAGSVGSALDPTPGAFDNYIVEGLTDGTPLRFSVAATNSDGTGIASPESPDVTPSTAPTAPFAPANPSATAGPGGGQASIQWIVPADNGSAVTSFTVTAFNATSSNTQSVQTIQAGNAGSQLDPTPGATDSYVVQGLTGGSSYSFYVGANNSVGSGNSSDHSNAVTPSPVVNPPAAPTGVGAYGGGGGIAQVQWTVPADNNSPITSFTIIPNRDGVAGSAVHVPAGGFGTPTSATPHENDQYQVGGLATGEYTFTVAASNSAGTGPASAPSAGLAVTAAPAPSLTASTTEVGFGSVRLGNAAGSSAITLTNEGGSTDSITRYAWSGPASHDFGVIGNCRTLAPQQSCQIVIGFLPGAIGSRQATVTIVDGSPQPVTISAAGTGSEGYYIATDLGHVHAFGSASVFGDLSNIHLAKPIVSMAVPSDDRGYWLVASDGGIFTFGDAHFYGSTGNIHLAKPIVGMAPTPDGRGYWLVASDGGIFTYGDAHFYGSTGAISLNKPIVGMTVTPDGHGYRLVASDGGIFTYGDAHFYGSTGNIHLAKPIVGMAPTPDGRGYNLLASDGGLFSFGDAHFYGSTGSRALARPIVAMAMTADGSGYWLVTSDGQLFPFGDAPPDGSFGDAAADIVQISLAGGFTLQATVDAPG